MNLFLSRESSERILQKILKEDMVSNYDYEKHRIILLGEKGQEQVYFRLPITIPPPPKFSGLNSNQVNYIILLIQSGSCALGYFEDGKNLLHKVFRSYMVRMKQGTSQVKYLKTKGKSRAGSRVRLAETEEFFENINSRLQEYFKTYDIHRIAMSCSKILIPFFFNAKIATPFPKKDERIFKIPKHVHLPIYEVMMDVNKFLQKGELIYEDSYQELVNQLLENTSSDLEE